MDSRFKRLRILACLSVAWAAFHADPVQAVPYFARKYQVACSQCHSLPPALNQFGQEFVAGGYRHAGLPEATRTFPVAAWVTHRAEIDLTQDRAKAFPNRIELIASDAPASWLSYFVEWRPLSYQTAARQRLLGRHGRFEDLFLQFALHSRATLTVGQFRMMNQWDVSRRLSLSEPAGLSASVSGPLARNARIRSLRSFSWAGRAPALRATVQSHRGDSPSDGWFHEFTLPFSGELSIPLGPEARRNASFALEARPKGFVYETYRRRGLTSVGGAVYLGGDRWVANATAVLQSGRHSLLASAGTGRFLQGHSDLRLTIGDTWIPRRWFAAGARLDHQSGVRRRPAFIPHVNFSFPGGSYTFLLSFEQRLQQDAHAAFIEFSAVF